MFDLLSIEEICDNTLSRIKKIFLILPEDVSVEPRPACCIPMTSFPTLIDGKAMYSVAFDRNTARFVSKKNIGNRAGDYLDNQLNFTVKKTRIELETLSTMLMNRKVHALIVFKNAKIKYIQNLRCEDEMDSGDKSNRDEHRFRFTSRSLRHAPSVSGVLPPEISSIIPSPPTQTGECMMIGIDENGFSWCIKINSVGDLVVNRL